MQSIYEARSRKKIISGNPLHMDHAHAVERAIHALRQRDGTPLLEFTLVEHPDRTDINHPGGTTVVPHPPSAGR